jgi:hypothetical protein
MSIKRYGIHPFIMNRTNNAIMRSIVFFEFDFGELGY